MARYRQKDNIDLSWNAIRRAITMKIDLECKTWREYRLNEELAGAWQEFAKALGTGEVLEVDPETGAWVKDALSAAPTPNAAHSK